MAGSSRAAAPKLGWFALWGWLGASWIAIGSCPVAEAQNSPLLQRDNPLRAWLPTPEARSERERAALEQKLEALLARQPGVAQADVVLSLPNAALTPLERPLPPARATLVVRLHDRGADLSGLTELARQVLPPGTEVQLTRVAAAARAERPMPRTAPSPSAGPAGRVGPFWVEGRSAGPLRATLAGLLLSNALLAGLLLWRRARR